MKAHGTQIRSWLVPIALALSLLVILSGFLAWSAAVTYGLALLMFAAVFAARSAERRERPER